MPGRFLPELKCHVGVQAIISTHQREADSPTMNRQKMMALRGDMRHF